MEIVNLLTDEIRCQGRCQFKTIGREASLPDISKEYLKKKPHNTPFKAMHPLCAVLADYPLATHFLRHCMADFYNGLKVRSKIS